MRYVVIGAFAGSPGDRGDHRGIDIVPSTREDNLRKLDAALREMNASEADGRALDLAEAASGDGQVIRLTTDFGEMKIVPTPDGTRGYDDLRRGARENRLGEAFDRRSRRSGISPGWLRPTTVSDISLRSCSSGG